MSTGHWAGEGGKAKPELPVAPPPANCPSELPVFIFDEDDNCNPQQIH